MNFYDAYQRALEGRAIRRKGWSAYFHVLPDETVLVWDETNQPVTFGNDFDELSYTDLNAKDWEVVPK